MKLVEIVKTFRNFYPGDRASLPDRIADQLVVVGGAKHVEIKPSKSKRGRKRKHRENQWQE